MSQKSTRLELPYIQPSQAQKHVTHNEALLRLDGIVQLSVVAFGAETPPLAPAEGEIHALGAAPSGDWAGQADMLAVRDANAWRVKTSDGAGWQPWRHFYDTQTLVGTVSDTGGTPDGAVIERGSGTDGDYVRFADGTQICNHSLTLDAATSAAGSGFQGATATAWNFPKAFATGSRPAVQGSDTNLEDTLVSAHCAGPASASFRAMRFVSDATAPVVEVTAIGRWK
ncbi:DUF2793 domain-containing protein [Alisedimentitalea sp. MJ-SS2]|uniref:DUF2793 domain-containing protein n=1 Tax=Aliisedimentitalea sp. MJ-SS2 TaxID=3049795 RepID=UPI00290F3EAF|nr:DUF2793 domain-containing protein [Alisedimentitalea sp. MJ-SS2]MDU8930029.1 DUF2793 domain-containing protein [Alisedimentitalea sp. MJ-SS2]